MVPVLVAATPAGAALHLGTLDTIGALIAAAGVAGAVLLATAARSRLGWKRLKPRRWPPPVLVVADRADGFSWTSIRAFMSGTRCNVLAAVQAW